MRRKSGGAPTYACSVALDLGLMLAEQGRFDQARELFRRVLAVAPNFVQARWAHAIARFPAAIEPNRNPDEDKAALDTELDELDSWFRANGMTDAQNAVGVLQPLMLAYHEWSNRDLMLKYGGLCFRAMTEWQQQQGLVPAARGEGSAFRWGLSLLIFASIRFGVPS